MKIKFNLELNHPEEIKNKDRIQTYVDLTTSLLKLKGYDKNFFDNLNKEGFPTYSSKNFNDNSIEYEWGFNIENIIEELDSETGQIALSEMLKEMLN